MKTPSVRAVAEIENTGRAEMATPFVYYMPRRANFNLG